jgi:hypothetical protein
MRVFVRVASRARAFRRIHRMSSRPFDSCAVRLFVCFCVLVSVCVFVCSAVSRRWSHGVLESTPESSPLQMTSVASAPNVHVIAVEGCAGFRVPREYPVSTLEHPWSTPWSTLKCPSRAPATSSTLDHATGTRVPARVPQTAECSAAQVVGRARRADRGALQRRAPAPA